MRDAAAVMNDHVEALMAIPGVVGVGVGALEDGAPCILVFVSRKTGEHERLVPRELEGHRVVVEETGEFRALDRP